MIPWRRRDVLVLGIFILFCSGFFPSLWIYLPVVFVVGDFQMGSLSDILFVADEVISFCFLVFLLIVRHPCIRTAGGPLHTLLAWGLLAVAAEQ